MLPTFSINRIARTLTATLATGYCITRFIAEPILLQGPSMEPTIQNNDVIIAEKLTSTFRKNDYKRGDIVVVRSPLNPHNFICKRIAGLPGDSVRVNYFPKIVPRGHVWLLGDNKTNSTDSRDFGSLPMGLIIGRVIVRIWPPGRVYAFKSIEDNENEKCETIFSKSHVDKTVYKPNER